MGALDIQLNPDILPELGLNPKQLEAVQYFAGPVLILAGAGMWYYENGQRSRLAIELLGANVQIGSLKDQITNLNIQMKRDNDNSSFLATQLGIANSEVSSSRERLQGLSSQVNDLQAQLRTQEEFLALRRNQTIVNNFPISQEFGQTVIAKITPGYAGYLRKIST